MGEREELPDHLRCKRTDGRQWRCNRKVMDDKKLCDIHHLQGRHRQYRRKVPESLKLQRKKRRKLRSGGGNDHNAPVENGEVGEKKEVKLGNLLKLAAKKKSVKTKKKKNKRKRSNGEDLQMELIRMVLKRQVEKISRKKKKVGMESETEEVDGENDHGDDEEEDWTDGDSEEEGELMRDLPYGLMAISPAKNFGNVGSGGGGGSCSSSSHCDVKIGGGGREVNAITRRRFRSKNAEPSPIGTLQVLPYKGDVVKLRRGKRKRCHWCRRSGLKTLIRCSSCQKEFFCVDCIKEQFFDMQEEVKMSCPVCRGTCSCKACSAVQCRDIECKGFTKDRNKVDKVLHFHYLICMLLPVLKQINQDHHLELEIEAKLRGQKQSEVQIQQVEASCSKQCYCDNCKTSIVDFHRSCPNCSYNLCLRCFQNIYHGSLPGSIKALICNFANTSVKCISGEQDSEMKSQGSLKTCNGNKNLGSRSFSPWWKVPDKNGGIPCPPSEFGGCGNSLLHLSCLFPLRWTRELEISAEEIIGCYELPETLDISSCCSLCHGIDCEASEIKQLQVAAAREDSRDNILYYPTILDIHNDTLEHFQKHWGKGHPVIVRNVLQGSSDLSWDPIIMFCTYLKNNAAKSETEQANDQLDWFEVEIGIRQLFMGSFKGFSHGNMWHEKLKLKGWLSSRLFQEHFPAHYAEILQTLPLPEYMDPMSGVLNIAAELPQEILKPDLGPNIYISYGSGEKLIQDDSVTKLRYDSYDVVNILAHTSDAPVSTEQLNYIRKLMKKHKEQDKVSKVPLEGENSGGLQLHEMVREEMNIHKNVARVSWFSAATHEAHTLGLNNTYMLNDEENDSDTDTDTEVSQFFFGPVKNSRTCENNLYGRHTESSNHFRKEELANSCGAEWDVFRRQDVPKLLEYLRRHSNEFPHPCGFRTHVVHSIFDQKFFLDTTHKRRLKEEFKIEPWTFEQHVGEAVIIPAGCPYQIRNVKSCVSVVLDFISPENVNESIHLTDELRLLPVNHKARVDSLEVKRMALHSISRAIREIRQLTSKD